MVVTLVFALESARCNNPLGILIMPSFPTDATPGPAEAANHLTDREQQMAFSWAALLAGPALGLRLRAAQTDNKAEAAQLERSAAADIIFQPVPLPPALTRAQQAQQIEIYSVQCEDPELGPFIPDGCVFTCSAGQGERVIPALLSIRRQMLHAGPAAFAPDKPRCDECGTEESAEWFESVLCLGCHTSFEADDGDQEAAAGDAKPAPPADQAD